MGDDFRRWKSSLAAAGTSHHIDLNLVDISHLLDFTEELRPDSNGFIIIEPNDFIIVRTLEHVTLPAASKIAARVEGRSKQARLGMTAHITAPTIHAGFAGKITLEIKNFGPFYLKVTPNDTRLCQLVFESVVGMPIRDASKSFKNQESTLGSPKPKKKVNERAFASKAIITLQRRRFRFRTVFHDPS